MNSQQLIDIAANNNLSIINLRDIALIGFFVSNLDLICKFANDLATSENNFIPHLVNLHIDVINIYDSMNIFQHAMTKLPRLISNLNYEELTQRYEALEMLFRKLNKLYSELIKLGDEIEKIRYLVPTDIMFRFDKDVSLIKDAIIYTSKYLDKFELAMNQVSTSSV